MSCTLPQLAGAFVAGFLLYRGWRQRQHQLSPGQDPEGKLHGGGSASSSGGSKEIAAAAAGIAGIPGVISPHKFAAAIGDGKVRLSLGEVMPGPFNQAAS